MKLDTLTKLNNKKKMWISPKHPLYFEELDFKIRYAAGIFVHAGRNKTVNTLNNFELQRLLNKGLGLDSKEMASVIKLAMLGDRIVDEVMCILDDPVKKYLYLMDLLNVCMRSTPITEEETKSIYNYVEILRVREDEYKLLNDYIKCSSSFDSESCIKIFEQMLEKSMPLTMSELKYYIPEIAYITQIESKMIKQGKNLRLVDNCEIKDTIIVPTGTTLNIANAVIKMYGSIIVDGGKLIIQDSKIVNKDSNSEAMIIVKNFSEVHIYNSIFDCRFMGSAINQGNGTLKIENSKFFHTTRNSAIRFWGKDLQIEKTLFHDCFSLGNGAAILIEEGNGIIKECTFENCEAKNGGAIYTHDGIMIVENKFYHCMVEQYGAAIFYQGEVKSNVELCDYIECIPKKEELVQYISGADEKIIKNEYIIKVATILDQPLHVTGLGILSILGSKVYVNKTIICEGSLNIKNSHIIAGDEVGRDLFVVVRSRGCNIDHSEFDGHLRAGIFCATGTRMLITNTIFRNTANGRAIFDAFEPVIRKCIFTYCLGGAINSCSGSVTDSLFVNCKSKSGAGILMYGTKGEIAQCKFIKCISDYSGGAIDVTLGNLVNECEYEENTK